MNDFWAEQARRDERKARGERIAYRMRRIDIADDRSVAVGFSEGDGYLLVFTAGETVTKVALSTEAFEALRALANNPPGPELSTWEVVLALEATDAVSRP